MYYTEGIFSVHTYTANTLTIILGTPYCNIDFLSEQTNCLNTHQPFRSCGALRGLTPDQVNTDTFRRTLM